MFQPKTGEGEEELRPAFSANWRTPHAGKLSPTPQVVPGAERREGGGLRWQHKVNKVDKVGRRTSLVNLVNLIKVLVSLG